MGTTAINRKFYTAYIILPLTFIFLQPSWSVANVAAQLKPSAAAQGKVSEASSSAPNPIDTQEYLRRFHENPKKVMTSPLQRYDERGRIVTEPLTPFEMAGSSVDEMIRAKDAARLALCQRNGRKDCAPKLRSVPGTYSGATERNQIENFIFEPSFLRRPKDMEDAQLLESAAAAKPWSDSFWPMQKGILARRWTDSTFPGSRVWNENYDHFLFFPPGSRGIDNLSPAEKYDLLVGDYAFTMTNTMWAQGRYYVDKMQPVPGWAGLCHGWAPAAVMAPNPQRSVTVTSINGQPITFYPSDIKALASAGWGEARVAADFRQVGERCPVNSPQDDTTGRVKEEACFDVNPGTWHMAIVNQLGVQKRAFIMDSQYDFQVWNFPVYAYRYQYFNPQTLAVSKTMAGSSVRMDEFTADKFKNYRSPDAKFVVGIAMETTYVSVTGSSRRAQNNPKLVTYKFVYDLELDASGSIIGGEWYSNFHPDFIWHMKPESRPKSEGEAQLPAPIAWDGVSPLPQELASVAPVSSAKLQPVWPIVEALLNLSTAPGVAP